MRISNSVSLIAVGAASVFVSFTLTNYALAASSPYGVWLDHTGSGAIEIKKCGKALCGYIVWVKDPRDVKKGCGKPLIRNVKYVGNNTWDRGLIYSPTDGKDYSVELKPISRSKLKVLGYAGSKFFSKTMYWKRAPSSLKRCDKGSKSKTQVAKKESNTKSGATPAKEIKIAALTDAPPPVRRPRDIGESYSSQPTNVAAIAAPMPELVPPKPVLARRPMSSSSREIAARQVNGMPAMAVGGPKDGDNADGLCTIRVPFVTISVPCNK